MKRKNVLTRAMAIMYAEEISEVDWERVDFSKATNKELCKYLETEHNTYKIQD